MGARKKATGNVRLAGLALGVIILHTLVTILEERLFSLESFTANAGGAFMTLYMVRAAPATSAPNVP